MAVTGEVFIVVKGGFTIHFDDSVVVKLTLSLISSLSSINPHRHAVVHPFVEPSFLLLKVASS